jgi:predicted PurR-regulated permease PerM
VKPLLRDPDIFPAPSGDLTDIKPPGELPDIKMDFPPYPELKTVLLAGIFLMIFLTVLHSASDLIIPIVLAFILKLVFQPVQWQLESLRIPRILAALMVVCLLLGGTAAVVTAVSGPASTWFGKLSDGLPELQHRLSFLSNRMETAQKMVVNAESMTRVTGPKIVPVTIEGTQLSDRIFVSTRAFLSSLFITVLVLFFLLASGDTFLRRLVEILPRFRDKRQAVDISQQVQHDISMYLLTITFMNALVGLSTGLVMTLCGLQDAMLWGTFAFLLNYVPIIGPLAAFVIFLLVGLLQDPSLGVAILPAFIYLGVHTSESLLLTPLLLARRFTLNPVLVILSLVFWYWMWGFAGAILAMPMLSIMKIVCDRVTALKPFGHFLEG